MKPLNQIECRDALLNPDGSIAQWPAADVILGNPPFLGDKKMRTELGATYTSSLRKTYSGRVPGGADLVCYWFAKAREAIQSGQISVAGLVATNSIRSGQNRVVLDSIAESTRIYTAWSDQPWVNEGAAVRVSLVAFGRASHGAQLDGIVVAAIRSDLTAALDDIDQNNLTKAMKLPSNAGVSFQGPVLIGAFDIEPEIGRSWLLSPNPHSRPNSDVLRPLTNGKDITARQRGAWVIDFDNRNLIEASLYDKPFEHTATYVKPTRATNPRAHRRERWWIHGETGAGWRSAIRTISRYIGTSRVAKYRMFVWLPSMCWPSDAVVGIARADDTTFGILHSRFHELWSLRTGSSLEDRPRYTPSTCFETFPFPRGLTPADTAHQRTERLKGGPLIPTGLDAAHTRLATDIAVSAYRLVELRDAWLNPLEWTRRVPEVVPLGMTASPFPDRVEPVSGLDAEVLEALQRRTLTNLYNERPTWLDAAHKRLDDAVAAAYGWSDYTPKMTDDEILSRLLELNRSRSSFSQA